jgi:hypothetical protein
MTNMLEVWCFPGEQDYASEEVLSGYQPGSMVLLS